MRLTNDHRAYGWLAGLLTLLIGLLVNASCACAQHCTIQQIHEEYDAAVKIEAHCVKEDKGTFSTVGWYGSGVIVDSRRLLTAAHVTDDEGMFCSFVTTDSAGKARLAFPLRAVAANDLASMELAPDEPDFAPVHVTFGGKPMLGSTVCTSSAFPRVARKCGEVQPYTDPPGDLVMGIVVEPGNSGSALYDEYGRLVGIVTHLTYCANHQWCGGKSASLYGHTKDLLP